MEVFTSSLHLVGSYRDLRGQQTFGEVLNEPEVVLHLHEVQLDSSDADGGELLPLLVLEKEAIYLAVPTESAAYQAERRVYRLGLPLPTQLHLTVMAMLGRFVVTGETHLLPSGNPAEHADPSASLRNGIEKAPLKRFFPLTRAKVIRDGGHLADFGVVFVNRDRVDAIVPLRRREQAEQAS